MSVPPLRLHNHFEPYISGDVTIHPSAVLAPGVILQAATNSKIIIGTGVCIGMGSILQVNEGTLEVEAGANLGAGFLMVGAGKIGTNACIGAATTVFNCSVEPGRVVPPSSVLGDTSRQISLSQTQEPLTNNAVSPNVQEQQPEENNFVGSQEKPISISSTNLSASAFLELNHQSISIPQPSPTPSAQPPPPEKDETAAGSSEISADNSESSDIFGTQIYGQGSIHRLLTTLFPHRQSLNNPKSDEPPE
ncbi:hexapeptide repeat-containing transferase [Anabaenopsis circularis NIES-21]|uniref:Hexapeptide repeat-containing transferase n=1 Tax=Anabaenopsis circularis NIES-21 TaxID=1085406 RepID=A0A1Z4GNP7_9CYAN|nr:hexapeptide repeat-containing transferase [Anabaenopsis circularis NIES-21]